MTHYISNKDFTASIIEYIKECTQLESEGKDVKQIPNDIARQFLAIATKLGSRYNFAGYTFRDDMESAAIFACCAKIRKFNPEIGTNAFAYFTNVCWRAMVDVINYEQKMSYIKAKAFQSLDFEDALSDNDLSEFGDYSGNANDYVPFFDVADYERRYSIVKEPVVNGPKVKKIAPAINQEVLEFE